MRVCACVHACHKSVSGPLSRPPMATCCRPSTLNGRGAPEAAEARPRARRPVDECSCRATRRVMCCMRALSSGARQARLLLPAWRSKHVRCSSMLSTRRQVAPGASRSGGVRWRSGGTRGHRAKKGEG